MKYWLFTWSKEKKIYEAQEINSDTAYVTLKKHYRTSLVKRLQGKAFRLRLPYGWMETETKEGLRPMPNFYGICE